MFNKKLVAVSDFILQLHLPAALVPISRNKVNFFQISDMRRKAKILMTAPLFREMGACLNDMVSYHCFQKVLKKIA